MEKFVKSEDKTSKYSAVLLDEIFSDTAEKLCQGKLYDLKYKANYELPTPSIEDLSKCISLLRSVIFPGYFGIKVTDKTKMKKDLQQALEEASAILLEQIYRVLCFDCSLDAKDCAKCRERAEKAVVYLISRLPEIRRLLLTDVEAAYEGDPAAKSIDEVILCYPSIKALTNHRISHELYKMDIPLIPRLITEMAHAETGIDIHPGAEIGERFFMDHGTGIVIGETSIIGKNVKIYQGVTLGAKSFPLDERGMPVKDVPRHPIVEDDVIIYACATILGRVRIGKGAIIGSNAFVTKDVPPSSKVFAGRENVLERENEKNL